jgi:hypothetical protein
MTSTETLRLRRDRIRDVLNREWDPIGGCPPDEYYAYADRINSMIVKNATDIELVQYLDWAVSVNMGFGGSNSEHSRSVVAAIRTALKKSN